MRWLAVNGSPRGQNGATDVVLRRFLAGAGRGGATATVRYLKELEIAPCTGCKRCLHNRRCSAHDDDMTAVLEEIRAADALVLASPVYLYNVSGLMKNFLDRCLPIISPPLALAVPTGVHASAFFIAVGGLPDRERCLPLVELMSSALERFAGSVVRSMAELLLRPDADRIVAWYFEAVEQAGYEAATQGRIAPETMAVLDRDLCPRELYRSVVARRFRTG